MEKQLQKREQQADNHIILIKADKMDMLSEFIHDPKEVIVVMPCINQDKAKETARFLYKRAGMDCKIVVVNDTARMGFISIVNKAASFVMTRYLVYLAEDAYPGLNWLKLAYDTINRRNYGLLAFNDGKWRGRVASFGMVRTAWVKKLYGGHVFYDGYKAHKADNEITVIARANKAFIYNPDCVLIEVDKHKVFKENVEEDKALFWERFRKGFEGLIGNRDIRRFAPEYMVPLDDTSEKNTFRIASSKQRTIDRIKRMLQHHPVLYNVAEWMARFAKKMLKAVFSTANNIQTFFNKHLYVPVIVGLQHNRAKKSYAASKLRNETDSFVLYRIVGNDLPPRHVKGQTYANLKFILEHEPDFAQCQKIWVLNRISDPTEQKRIEILLKKHKRAYFIIPFEEKEYAKTRFVLSGLPEGKILLAEPKNEDQLLLKLTVDSYVVSQKNKYLMNNNGARNAALKHGKERAKWILPWDGNCFITQNAWDEISGAIIKRPWLKYFIVPMARISDNNALIDPSFVTQACEEPQIIFRKDAMELFDESLPYGKVPKAELLRRLMVPGIWDQWVKGLHPWDQRKQKRSKEKKQYGYAGWVARLNSGNTLAETSRIERLKFRDASIVNLIKQTDIGLMRERFDQKKTAYYRAEQLDKARRSKWLMVKLQKKADDYFSNTTYSVTHKTGLPPSGNQHDYWHPAPYYWPNPDTPDGLPYVLKDSQRVPRTELYAPESKQYDRTSLQRMFDESTVLSMAYSITGNNQYANKSAELIRTWFIKPDTRMNPHLRYAQVRMGHNKNQGSKSGLIETKDFYFFLDAVRIIRDSDFWSDDDEKAFSAWCKEFLDWLINSEQGQQEKQSINNHGVCYDLQTASFAAFLGDLSILYDIEKTARARLMDHIDKKGRQPGELKRNIAFHYCAFNLQSWLNLAILLENTTGDCLWSFDADGRGSIEQALHWLLPFYRENWPFKQTKDFNKERLVPLYHLGRRVYPSIRDRFEGVFTAADQANSCYFPHDGIPVFWTVNTL